MNSVKEVPGTSDEVHVAMLLGAVSHRLNHDFDPARWDGLRISRIRVVTCVPEEGISITALADRVRMTKQACGQFVSDLVDSGHLRVEAAADRRLRLVHRSEQGQRLVRRVARHMAEVEEVLAAEVGPQRYATFRAVLAELAAGA
jgi:DNA-binding MarR family transcriptional regulator